jgi:hypothetical protein
MIQLVFVGIAFCTQPYIFAFGLFDTPLWKMVGTLPQGRFRTEVAFCILLRVCNRNVPGCSHNAMDRGLAMLHISFRTWLYTLLLNFDIWTCRPYGILELVLVDIPDQVRNEMWSIARPRSIALWLHPGTLRLQTRSRMQNATSVRKRPWGSVPTIFQRGVSKSPNAKM